MTSSAVESKYFAPVDDQTAEPLPNPNPGTSRFFQPSLKVLLHKCEEEDEEGEWLS